MGKIWLKRNPSSTQASLASLWQQSVLFQYGSIQTVSGTPLLQVLIKQRICSVTFWATMLKLVNGRLKKTTKRQKLLKRNLKKKSQNLLKKCFRRRKKIQKLNQRRKRRKQNRTWTIYSTFSKRSNFFIKKK